MVDNDKQTSYQDFENEVDKSLKIDRRLAVLDFKESEDFLFITTDSTENAKRISTMYAEVKRDFRIKVALLPLARLHNQAKGICHVGVAPVRRSSASASEQVTQVLYGETFDTLDVTENWVRVRLHIDGYVGWVSRGQVTLLSEKGLVAFLSIPIIRVAEKVVPLYKRPDPDSEVLREAMLGNSLAIVGKKGKFLEVKTPDGKKVYVLKSATTRSMRDKIDFSLKHLFDDAKDLQGISYIWGGRSPHGFDCSGFTQTVFALNGISLPRDADLQYRQGEPVGNDTSRLRPGDLLFFSSNGNKIEHVAIYVGKNKTFIHSSEYVRVNSFDRGRKDFSKKLLSRFIGARRIV